MNLFELRATSGLASIYAVRMLGLFMVLPVFMLHLDTLPGATPLLMGLAVGIYGLTQALLQIPFGLLSDRVGRKPLILLGLALFVLGSLVAALAESVYGIILGRALQGGGAVAAVILALTADLIGEERRMRALAVIGLTIGLSFSVSMVLGPIVDRVTGLSGIFGLSAVLGVVAMGILVFWVPSPERLRIHPDMTPTLAALPRVLLDRELWRLNGGVFVLHAVLAANFLVIPMLLVEQLGLAGAEHWKLYLPVLLVGFALMLPGIIIGERRRRVHQVMYGAIALLAAVQLLLALVVLEGGGWWALLVLLTLFFAAFNLLEAGLPSLVARMAPVMHKGTAMGGFSSAQFLGIFAGGVGGGAVLGAFGPGGVFLAGIPLLLLWLWVGLGLQPKYRSNRVVAVPAHWFGHEEDLQRMLAAWPRVTEVALAPDRRSLYWKAEPGGPDSEALREWLEQTPPAGMDTAAFSRSGPGPKKEAE